MPQGRALQSPAPSRCWLLPHGENSLDIVLQLCKNPVAA